MDLPVESSTSLASGTSVESSQGDFPGYGTEIAFDSLPGDNPQVWTDVTDYVKSLNTNRGKDSELDQDQPGTASYVLRNNDRRFDPTYSSGPYFGNILPMRRIRTRAQWNGTWDPIFSGYIESWPQSWPDRLFQSDVSVQAVDGFKVLTLKAQPTTDPSADSYEDVVAFDEPAFLYPLNDPAGTKVVHHVRKKKRKHETRHHYNHHKRRAEEVNISEATGISGPAGVYKNTPQLVQSGLIRGSSEASARFRRAQSEYVVVNLDDIDDAPQSEITLEAWINPDSLASNASGHRNMILSGPPASFGVNLNVWNLYINDVAVATSFPDSGGLNVPPTSSTTLIVGNTYYVVVSVDSLSNANLYLGDVAAETFTLLDSTSLASINAGVTTPYHIKIGGADNTNYYFDGRIQWAGVYQQGLSQDRLEAHFEAGLRGYDQDTTGNRIADVLSEANLGFSTSLHSGGREVIPVRQSGQSSTEPVDEAVAAEGGPARFFFAADLTAKFLDRDHRTIAPWDSSRATFGDDGIDLPYYDVGAMERTDAWIFNKIRMEASGGTMQEVNDATSIATYLERTLERTGVPMVSDADALDEATDLLARFKDAMDRIPSITFQLGAGSDALYSYMQAAVLERELGDCITINRRPGGGDVITQTSYIERISHAIDFEAKTWQTVFAVSPK